MKKLISVLLILTTSFAFAQSSKNFPGENKFFNQPENFLLRKDPLKNMEFYKTKFIEYQSLKENEFALIRAEAMESNNRKNENSQKIRTLFAKNKFKSAQLDTTLIDSVCVFSFKTLHDSTLTAKIFTTYNGKGNHHIILRQELDTVTQQFKNKTKEEYFLDQNNKDTLVITHIWDSELNNWRNEGKYVTIYDDKGNMTLSTFLNWLNTNEWVGVYMFQYEFDKNGNKILDSYYTWNENINKWQGINKNENKYDESNNLIMNSTYLWDFNANTWMGSYKNENVYNNNGNLNSIISSIWDENKKDWKYQSKQNWHTENNENDFFGFSEYYSWIENSGKWVGNTKLIYYSSVENETQISCVWNIADEIWEQSQKTVLTKNETGLERTNNLYQAKDSVITGTLINGFNSSSDISKILLSPSCPDKTCTVLDTDVAEGDSALLWNYNFVGSTYPDSGFCQIQLDNKIDLSDNSGLFISYKVIKPFKNIFIIRLTEASGEIWMAEIPYIFNDLNGKWQQMSTPFSSFFLTANNNNGYLNKESITKIELRIYVPDNIKVSGSVLLDNFSSCNIRKTDTWVHLNTEQEIFDEKGNSILTVHSRWNSVSKEFIPFYKLKNEINYNENGLISKKVTSYWNEFDINWKNESKYIYEYDDSGNLTKTEFYGWNEFNSNWEGLGKTETTWDEFGNIILNISYGRDYETGDWLPGYKSENNYSASGLQIMNSFYYWDNVAKKWRGSNKNETVLNVNGELIKNINYEWDFSANDWRVSFMDIHTKQNEIYNDEGLISLMSTSNWDENLNIWSPTEKSYFYYSSHSVSTDINTLGSFENNIVEIYPNPASEVINIQFRNEVLQGSYSLFNTNGQLRQNGLITDNTTTLQVGNLPNGIYILIIETNKTKISKKIVLQ